MFWLPEGCAPGWALALLVAFLSSDLYADSVHRHYRTGAMGTDLQIDAFGSDADAVDAAIREAVQEIRRIEDLMTTWRTSPLMDLNAAAGLGPREVTPELAQIIGRARALHPVTQGAFDITFYSAGRLWDFKAAPPPSSRSRGRW